VEEGGAGFLLSFLFCESFFATIFLVGGARRENVEADKTYLDVRTPYGGCGVHDAYLSPYLSLLFLCWALRCFSWGDCALRLGLLAMVWRRGIPRRGTDEREVILYLFRGAPRALRCVKSASFRIVLGVFCILPTPFYSD
jgi:hypothetical protein